MSDELVLLQTYLSPVSAGAAQEELLAAGIHSILVSENPTATTGPVAAGVALAVHRRDAELAATVLALGAARDADEAGPPEDVDRT